MFCTLYLNRFLVSNSKVKMQKKFMIKSKSSEKLGIFYTNLKRTRRILKSCRLTLQEIYNDKMFAVGVKSFLGSDNEKRAFAVKTFF